MAKFKCEECGFEFENYNTETSIQVCPHCQHRNKVTPQPQTATEKAVGGCSGVIGLAIVAILLLLFG